MKHTFLSAVLMMATLTSPGMSQQPMQEALLPGDVVRLQLVIPGDAGQGQDYSGDYMVPESGTISLPLIGVIQAVSVPAQQLRSRIISEYGALFRNQAVQITLLRRISVLGAVKNPGLYHADPTMGVGDLIALAGGVTEAGKPDEVQIVRNGKPITADLSPASPLPPELRSGDQVYVPQKSWLTRNGVWLIGLTMGVVGVIVRY